jgi:hypothetical protein
LRQVRHSVWRLHQEEHQEDGGEPALQVQLRFLWEGQRQAPGDGHLEVRLVPESDCGAYMLNTPPAVTAKTTIGRMRKMLEAQS